MVMPIVAVVVEVLLEFLDSLFLESVTLWVLDSGEASLEIELSVQLVKELQSKLRTTI